MEAVTVRLKAEYSSIISDGKLKEFKPEIKEIPVCEKKLWRRYRNIVWKITEKQNLKKLKNFDKRGFLDYHLDHKVSIWYGYKNKIDPKLIGSIDNLEFIPYRDNMRKATKCNFKNAKSMQTIIFVD
jgi:hypothetical protein